MNEKGLNLYWENYRRAFEWQNNSHISHWKARVKALEVENALLREFIQRELQRGMHQQDSLPKVNLFFSDKSNRNREINDEQREDLQDTGEYSSESEIDEELLAFYEKTIRHKIERKKKQSLEQREDSEDSQNEKIYSMGPIASSQKSKEMALLYGSDAPKILSMELSMQINFDMNRNKSNAQLWPNIPLRLSR